MKFCNTIFHIQLGSFFIWTHTYSIMKKAGKIYHRTNQLGISGDGAKETMTIVTDPEAVLPELSEAEDEGGQTPIVCIS
jgi:hypothetical protein